MKKYLYKFGIFPLRLYWFLFRPNTFGVKAVIQRSDGKILFVRTTYGKGYWNFPGGRIDKQESPEDAVRREVLEEVGINLKSTQQLGTFLSTYEHKKDHVTVFSAKGSYDVGKIQASEIRDYRWCDKTEPPSPVSRIALKVLDFAR